MAENQYIFPKQNNVSFPLTFNMSLPAPLLANRIFKTKDDATAFIKENLTAIPGLILRVIGDTDANNGVYVVLGEIGNLRLEQLGYSGGEANVIEEVQVNGTALPVTDKAVNIDLSEYVKTKDLPKDLVVESGSIVKGTWTGDTFVESETGKDKALKLVIKNQTDPIYINVKDLCDVYTGDGTTITVSDANVISVKDGVYVEKDGYVAYSQDEKDKLSAIEAGAQVNKVTDVQTKTSAEEGAEYASVLEGTVAKIDLSSYVTGEGLNARVNPIEETLNGTGEGEEHVKGLVEKVADLEGAEANVQSDWNETDTTSDAYILNKPENIMTGTQVVYKDTYQISYLDESGNSQTISGLKYDASTGLYSDGTYNYQIDSDDNVFVVGSSETPKQIGTDGEASSEIEKSSTGDYALILGDTTRTIASIAQELDGIVAEGGEPNVINQIQGETAIEGGSDDYISVSASNPVNKVVTLDSKVKVATLTLTDEDGNVLSVPTINVGLINNTVLADYVAAVVGWEEIN